MVRTLLLTLTLVAPLGCDPAPAPEAAPAPTPVTPTSPQGEPAASADAPPAGSIGGGVILERPVVLGGIENDAVEGALDMDKVRACNTAGRAGKVLLKFHIDAPGTVSQVKQKASTLRHEETEACLRALVQGTAFPPLTHGSTAIVTWPFSL